ncbi:MAG: radical SAM protein [Thermodesulfovibrionales bacterium]|nr:radical SAM protein [Thermodesulfovibrionales bacterium]
MNRKILFITPPYHCGVVEVAGRWAPLTFAYLAGEIRKHGFEPFIYDAMTKQKGFPEIREKIKEIAPAFVATTAITSTVMDSLEVLRIAKEVNPEIKTIIGGVHPTFMYEEVLGNDFVDFVVRGEGEITLNELLSCILKGDNPGKIKGIAFRENGHIIATPQRPFIEDLDSLSPAWDLIDWKDYRYFVIPNSRLGAISSSRGCSHGCTFCSQQKFWQRSWRARRPENVVREIEHLNREYGVNVFLIVDEYPTNDRERWERFLDLLIEKELGIYILMETRAEDILRDRDILWKYRKAGIVHIYIGVESTDQETLDLIKKDIRVETGIEALRLIHEHGMISETSFILGFPDETRQSIERTLKLSKIYNPDFAHYLALAPWPYADMYKELEPHIVTKDYRKYNLIDPVIKPVAMTVEELDRAIIDCYQSFYMGKLTEILNIKDEFKKHYILSSMKLIMNSSFIVNKLGSLGKIPPQVEMLLRKLEGGKERKEDFKILASGSAVINRPVEEVFEYVSNPENWPSFVSGLEDIKSPSRRLRKGDTFEWTFNVRGITLRGKGKVMEFINKKIIILQMYRLLPIKEVITFQGFEDKTTLSIDIGYERPGKILSFLFRVTIDILNIRQLHLILNNIKTILEKGNIERQRYIN